MCGIVGFVNYTKDVSSNKNIIEEMNDELYKRGPDESGIYLKEHVAVV